MLNEALTRYADLASKAVSNAMTGMSGAAIVDAYLAGELPYLAVGRQGGSQGPRLRQDLVSGNWRDTVYQVAQDLPPRNPNWLTVEQFVELLREAGQVADDAVAHLPRIHR